ncbi:MAG: 2Fe-2S ferredoxin [Chloroflexi bacterium HGW-Chloroflexi-1]|nr:MAG: 2Fe-2S ferredoxin [Chloroflexi bacterium HGW-Chloroflexi-1]
MPKIQSLEELRTLRAQLKQDIKARTETSTTITVGMGTCGIAAGAREVMQVFLDELATRAIDAHVVTTGCIGMCSKEPLVDIQQSDGPRITYGNVHPTMVPRIIEEHLIHGNTVQQWVVGQLA